jgi:hypothetical protein
MTTSKQIDDPTTLNSDHNHKPQRPTATALYSVKFGGLRRNGTIAAYLALVKLILYRPTTQCIDSEERNENIIALKQWLAIVHIGQ